MPQPWVQRRVHCSSLTTQQWAESHCAHPRMCQGPGPFFIKHQLPSGESGTALGGIIFAVCTLTNFQQESKITLGPTPWQPWLPHQKARASSRHLATAFIKGLQKAKGLVNVPTLCPQSHSLLNWGQGPWGRRNINGAKGWSNFSFKGTGPIRTSAGRALKTSLFEHQEMCVQFCYGYNVDFLLWLFQWSNLMIKKIKPQ